MLRYTPPASSPVKYPGNIVERAPPLLLSYEAKCSMIKRRLRYIVTAAPVLVS